MANEINKDSKISEIISANPQAIELLMGHGLNCVGCALSSWETLEQGVQVHGMSKKTLNVIIKKLNSLPKTKVHENEILSFTDRAIEQLAKLTKNAEKSIKYLRVAIFNSDFGLRYGFKFEKRKKKTDRLIRNSVLPFIIDGKDAEKLKGSRLDYLSFIPGTGFKIYKNAI